MAQYTIAYDGVDGEGNEARIAIPNTAYAGSSFFALTDAPLYRGDTLRFSLVPGTLPTPLPEQVYVSVDGVDAGAWTLTKRQSDVETGAFVAYEAKREADAQAIADAVMGILLTDVDGYNRAGIPLIQRRWAAILDGDLNGWIARRILGKGDKPTLDTLLRELPKYGYTLTLADVAPFNNAAIPISIVPLAVAAQSVAKSLPLGYRLTQYEEPLIDPLTRRLTFTAGVAEYFGGSGHAQHLGLAPTLGEGAVLLEMRRYHDYYTQERLTAEMPITAYSVRDLVRTGRDTPPRDWIVESVSHTEVATQLRLIRNKALSVDDLREHSPAPYNTSARPYNAKPGVPSVRIQYVFTSDDPRTPETDEVTINWRAVGGGAVAVITPPRFGFPLTEIEYWVRQYDGAGYASVEDGEYLRGAIPKPPPLIDTYLPLIPTAAGYYDIQVRAANAFGDRGEFEGNKSDWSAPVRFQIYAGTPAIQGITLMPMADLRAAENLTLDAQRRMFASAQIIPSTTNTFITALVLTGTAIAILSTAAVAGSLIGLLYITSAGSAAVLLTLGIKVSGIAIALQSGVSLVTSGYFISTASAFALGSGAGLAVLPVVPILGILAFGIFQDITAPRIAIIATAWGAGRKIGVAIQYRRSHRRGLGQNAEYSWEGNDWQDLEDDSGATSRIATTEARLIDTDEQTRERLLYTQWFAAYASGGQVRKANSLTFNTGYAVQFRIRAIGIEDIDGNNKVTGATRFFVGARWQYTQILDVRQWTERQFGDDGNYVRRPTFYGNGNENDRPTF